MSSFVADPRVKIVEATLKLIPEEGKNIFDVLAESKPTGFVRLIVNPDNTADMVIHQEEPVSGVEVHTIGG